MNDEIFNEIKDKFNAFIEEDRTLKYLLVNAENLGYNLNNSQREKLEFAKLLIYRV